MKRRCGFLFFALMAVILGFGTFVSCNADVMDGTDETDENTYFFSGNETAWLVCTVSDDYDSENTEFCYNSSLVHKDKYRYLYRGEYYAENEIAIPADWLEYRAYFYDTGTVCSYSYDSDSGMFFLYADGARIDAFQVIESTESHLVLKFESDGKYRRFVRQSYLFRLLRIDANGGSMEGSVDREYGYASCSLVGKRCRWFKPRLPDMESCQGFGLNGTFAVPTAESLDLKRDGWVFLGWASSDSATSAEIEDGAILEVTDDVSLYAIWIKNAEYTVTFDANGGMFGEGVSNTQSVAGETHTGELPVTLKTAEELQLSREGYTFKGWASSSTAGAVEIIDGEALSLSENKSLYAVWSHNVTYTVTFDAKGGNIANDSQEINGETILGDVEGRLLSKSSIGLSRGKDLFKGWSDSSNSNTVVYTDGSRITLNGDKTLYAIWNKFLSYTITYESNGGDISITTQTLEGYKDSGVVGSLITASELGCVRSGYKFKGWSTSAASSTITYTDGKNISLSGNVTLYAVWDKIVTYTISYDPNGGSMTSNASTTQTVTGTESEGASVTLRSASCSGYVFAGWAKSSSATTATYTSTTLPVTIYSNLTLFAVWKLPTYTVTFKQTTVFNSSSTTQTVEKGYYTLPTASSLGLSRSGYTFLGWSTSTSSSSYYPAGSSIEITRATTLYGIWQVSPNVYCYICLYKPAYSTNSQSMMYGPVSANVGGYGISPNNGYSSSAYTSSYYKVSAIGELSYTTLCKRRQTSLSTGGYTYTDITRSGTYTFEYGGYYTINCTTGAVTKN